MTTLRIFTALRKTLTSRKGGKTNTKGATETDYFALFCGPA